jgi:Caspase domain/Bacterial SH3 domain
MRASRCFLAFAVLAILLCIGAPARSGERVALVIGNAQYRHTPALANPKNDALSIAAALKQLDFTVLVGTDLDKPGTEAKLREFSRAIAGADVAIFFYAGHGLQVGGKNYMLPIDAAPRNETDLAFEAIDLSLVVSMMERATHTNLIFLDACRDNPLMQNLVRSMGTARSTAVGRGLAVTEAGLGTLLVFSTQPDKIALDGSGAHSPFTAALLEHIATPGIEVRQMLSRVRNSVITATNGGQVPWDHSSLVGDFFFAPAAAALAVRDEAASSANTADREALFWQSIRESVDPADFQAYLDRYPDGTFAALARNRLAALKPATPAAPIAVDDKTSATEEVAIAAPAPAAPDVAIEPMSARYAAKALANVRVGPSSSDPQLATLSAGQQANVTGKVKGRNWYRVALADGTVGYVFGDLLDTDGYAASNSGGGTSTGTVARSQIRLPADLAVREAVWRIVTSHPAFADLPSLVDGASRASMEADVRVAPLGPGIFIEDSDTDLSTQKPASPIHIKLRMHTLEVLGGLLSLKGRMEFSVPGDDGRRAHGTFEVTEISAISGSLFPMKTGNVLVLRYRADMIGPDGDRQTLRAKCEFRVRKQIRASGLHAGLSGMAYEIEMLTTMTEENGKSDGARSLAYFVESWGTFIQLDVQMDGAKTTSSQLISYR